jgi:surface carbohydrate biosynthesis protein
MSARQPLAALIVDNPLRDLDGLVLLAATLARRGVRSALVPMYEQGFDIPALRPDVVVANYVRANNRDLVARYRALGSRIVVLDSEGSAGRSAQDYARLVARMEPAALVDDYCVWGRARHEALLATGALPAERVHLTGCPRYDFCAPPWSAALAPTALPPGFILVNTNFPLPNPRFAASAEEERRTLQRIWADEAYVAAVYRDARLAFEGMLRAIEALARRFSATPVVVRPHPFESVAPYERLPHPGNLQVRQEGTSLQWIRDSRVLVHQNCSTALEAAMLGREPLSLEWLSTEALRLPGPSAVSHAMAGQPQLEGALERLLAGGALPAGPELLAARRDAIEEFFLANDGRASERVADVILACLERPVGNRARVRRAARSVIVDLARDVVGYQALHGLRRRTGGDLEARRRTAKAFEPRAVQDILQRLASAAGAAGAARVAPISPDLIARPRRYSGKSLQIVGAA